jgi:hypothetical protein
LLALVLGFPAKKFSAKEIFAAHYWHGDRFSHDLWLTNGQHFLDCVKSLQQSGPPHAQALLAELMEPEASLEQHLQRVARTICFGLP